MEKIDYTLIGDGTSDRCLLPILYWLLRRSFTNNPVNGNWADFARFARTPRSLAERISLSVELYQPDLLFIHRDAEAQEPHNRYDEINKAVSELKSIRPDYALPYICVVPVRMTEAWLLFDEIALRKASGNPNGRFPINLPPIKDLESLSDPKRILFDLLIDASELQGRHRRGFRPEKRQHLVADNIGDFSPLTVLAAFRRLQTDIQDLHSRMKQRYRK